MYSVNPGTENLGQVIVISFVIIFIVITILPTVLALAKKSIFKRRVIIMNVIQAIIVVLGVEKISTVSGYLLWIVLSLGLWITALVFACKKNVQQRKEENYE